MAGKEHLQAWVLEALDELGGSSTVVEVAEVVWRRHEHDLRASGPLFYTWQYDIVGPPRGSETTVVCDQKTVGAEARGNCPEPADVDRRALRSRR
jgi:hypothetical protein